MEKYDKSIDMDSVYREYEKLVYRFLYSHTHDAEWSQELMQETFLRAVNSISRYNGTCKLSVWLCQIAKHILYQELRKKKQIETVELVDYLTDDSAPNGETSILKQESKNFTEKFISCRNGNVKWFCIELRGNCLSVK